MTELSIGITQRVNVVNPDFKTTEEVLKLIDPICKKHGLNAIVSSDKRAKDIIIITDEEKLSFNPSKRMGQYYKEIIDDSKKVIDLDFRDLI